MAGEGASVQTGAGSSAQWDHTIDPSNVDQIGHVEEGTGETGVDMEQEILDAQEDLKTISENWDDMSDGDRKSIANEKLDAIENIEGVDPEFVAALREDMGNWDNASPDEQHDFVIMLQAMLMMMELGVSMKKAQRVGSQVENELAVGFLKVAADKIRSSAQEKFGMAMAGAAIQVGGAVAGIGVMNKGMTYQGQALSQGINAGGSMFSSTGDYYGQLGQAESEEAKADSQEHQYLSDEAKDIGQGTGQFFQALLQGFLSAIQAERGAESKGWFAV